MADIYTRTPLRWRDLETMPRDELSLLLARISELVEREGR